MKVLTIRTPETEKEKALFAAYEHEVAVQTVLRPVSGYDYIEQNQMDYRRYNEIRELAIDISRVRVAHLAAELAYRLPVREG